MSLCAVYNCRNKTFFILPKNECTRKGWIAAIINRKEGTLPQIKSE